MSTGVVTVLLIVAWFFAWRGGRPIATSVLAMVIGVVIASTALGGMVHNGIEGFKDVVVAVAAAFDRK